MKIFIRHSAGHSRFRGTPGASVPSRRNHPLLQCKRRNIRWELAVVITPAISTRSRTAGRNLAIEVSELASPPRGIGQDSVPRGRAAIIVTMGCGVARARGTWRPKLTFIRITRARAVMVPNSYSIGRWREVGISKGPQLARRRGSPIDKKHKMAALGHLFLMMFFVDVTETGRHRPEVRAETF